MGASGQTVMHGHIHLIPAEGVTPRSHAAASGASSPVRCRTDSYTAATRTLPPPRSASHDAEPAHDVAPAGATALDDERPVLRRRHAHGPDAGPRRQGQGIIQQLHVSSTEEHPRDVFRALSVDEDDTACGDEDHAPHLHLRQDVRGPGHSPRPAVTALRPTPA